MTPSRGEVAIYQRRHGQRKYVIERAGWSFWEPFNAVFVSASNFGSFENPPGGARFTPENFATPNGFLRLGDYNLTIDRWPMLTNDERGLDLTFNLLFRFSSNADCLCAMLERRVLQLTKLQLPARLVELGQAEISALGFEEAIADVGLADRVMRALRHCVEGTPAAGSGFLGVQPLSLTIERRKPQLIDPDGYTVLDTPYTVKQIANTLQKHFDGRAPDHLQGIFAAAALADSMRRPQPFWGAGYGAGGLAFSADLTARGQQQLLQMAQATMRDEIPPPVQPAPVDVRASATTPAAAAAPQPHAVQGRRESPRRRARAESRSRDFDPDRCSFKGPV